MSGVNISDGKVGASVINNDTKNSGFIAGGVAVTDNITLGEVYEIYQPDDAKALGIDAAYDTTNNVRVFYHIKEHFRKAGKGTRTFFMIVAQSVSMEDIVEDTNEVYAKKLLIHASDNGTPIYQLGVALNPEDGYTATIVDGLDSDVLAAVTAGKGLTEWANTQHLDLVVVLEGRDFTGTPAAAHDFRVKGEVEHNRVALCIAQDYDYADTLDALGKKHAAVGTLLGCIASREVHESVGWVEEMNLQDKVTKDFLNAGISSHVAVKTLGIGDGSGTEVLTNKGYLFARIHPGTSGYFFNSDFTCCPLILDDENNINIHSISQGRTSNKIIRGLRSQLTPKINSVVRTDKDTGLLDEGSRIFLEDEANVVFESSEALGEIVEGLTTIDPAISVTGSLEVSFEYVKTTILGEINGTVNQKLKF